MGKNLLKLFALVIMLFMAILISHFIWRPEMKAKAGSEELLNMLGRGANHFRENGEFRKRVWLDGKDWRIQVPPGSSPIKTAVPACWNALPGLQNYEGRAEYNLDFKYPMPAHKRNFLCFRGVSYTANVTFNEMEMEHSGAYTPFEFEIPNNAGQGDSNHLDVMVDNRLSMKTIPGKFEGWRHIGGIYREVYIEERSEVFIKDAKIIAEPVEGGGKIKIGVYLDNALGKSGQYLVEADLAGAVQQLPVSINGEKKIKAELEGTAMGAEPWSPDAPNLYPLSIKIFELSESEKQPMLLDRLDYQIGFRKLETSGGKILLNGAPLKIKGISRHHFYPGYFQTIPPALIESDLKKIKTMGANLVRLGHYPNHPYVLELCDRLGLLAWEEIPAWGKWSPDYADAEVIKSAKQQLEEMVLRDRNHASLAFVGLANEIPSDQPGGEIFVKELSEFIRPLLGNQLLAAASFSFEKDRAAKYLDVIGFNCYFGWYFGRVSDLKTTINKIVSTFKDKPIIISEFGSDAQIGLHGARGDIYTEENQARFLQQSHRIISEEPALSGAIIWLFADYPDPLRFLNPEPFFNQKGLLDENRNEKVGFKVAQSLYTDQPFTYYAKSRIPGRVRDGALGGLIVLVIFFGLFRPIPERWIKIMPDIGQARKLLFRAVIMLGFQTVVYEMIWRGFYGHQPLASLITIPFPAMKLLQTALNSSYRPAFIFEFLLLNWLVLAQFIKIVSDPKKIRRHPLELALGIGDPFAWAIPYPLIAFLPALLGIAVNAPSLFFSGGELLNHFSTITWIFFQITFLILIGLSFLKLIFVLRAGLGISRLRALLLMISYIFFINIISSLWICALVIL